LSGKVTGPGTNLLTHPHSHDDNVVGDTLLIHVGEFLPEGVEFCTGSKSKRVKRTRGFQMPGIKPSGYS